MQKVIKPTPAWTQTTNWKTSSFCNGSASCQYEPKTEPLSTEPTSGCNRRWQKHSQALFQAFMNANPTVMFHQGYVICVKEIEHNHRCNTRQHDPVIEQPIDHAEICRLPDGSRFIISQPYYRAELCNAGMAIFQEVLPDLRCVVAGSKRSWYIPNTTNLLLLGTQETLDSLNFNYPTPDETQPTRCTKFRTQGLP